VRVNNSGSVQYFPYGAEQTATPEGATKFATYFRDAAGQDYADQRYYNAGMGRFWSPDPAGGKQNDLTSPTTWNKYSYANQDPANFEDPTGESVVAVVLVCGWEGGILNTPPEKGFNNNVWSCQYLPISNGAKGPCDMSNPLNAKAINWILAHGADAAVAAAKIDTTPAIILGLSAFESGWGSGDFVTGSYNNGVPINNFFSQHAPAPGESGTVTINGNYMAAYASYAASAMGFVDSASGAMIAGISNPAEAMSDLQNAGLYGINQDGSKDPTFVKNAASTINFIQNRLGCVNGYSLLSKLGVVTKFGH